MIWNFLQLLADRHRTACAQRDHDAALRLTARSEARRRSVGQPWSDMIHPSVLWLFPLMVWFVVMLLAWRFW